MGDGYGKTCGNASLGCSEIPATGKEIDQIRNDRILDSQLSTAHQLLLLSFSELSVVIVKFRGSVLPAPAIANQTIPNSDETLSAHNDIVYKGMLKLQKSDNIRFAHVKIDELWHKINSDPKAFKSVPRVEPPAVAYLSDES